MRLGLAKKGALWIVRYLSGSSFSVVLSRKVKKNIIIYSLEMQEIMFTNISAH